MPEDLKDYAPFKEICRKICLNIPDEYRWTWDQKRNMALITMDKSDAELVYFPLFKEFIEHWNFSSPVESQTLIAQLLNGEYGLMPGQTFFTSRPINDRVLFVAWWPWGSLDKISMRVGLIALEPPALPGNFVQDCLQRWLPFRS